MTNCPKCGGITGFLVTKLTRNSDFVNWNGVVYHVEGSHLTENKRVKCIDCGALLKITDEINNLIINRNG
jgi:ribosomal protein S27AE